MVINHGKISDLSGDLNGISSSELAQITHGLPGLTGPRLISQFFNNQSLSNANLENADFRLTELFSVDLSSSNLRGADFSGASLSRVDLSGADLTGATLTGMRYTGGLYDVDFSGSNLRGVDFSGATLTRVDLSGADLTGADLSFTDSDRVKYDDKTVFPEGFDVTEYPSFYKRKPADVNLIDESGTYNISDVGPGRNTEVTGNDLDVTVNATTVRTSPLLRRYASEVLIRNVNNSTVSVNGGVGRDKVTYRVAEGNSSAHISIDGGDGDDVFESDFLSVEGSTVVKNEDGSYTIHAGDQVIEVKNFEGFIDLSDIDSEMIDI
ncbi:MAG: pentapeptide repeat-containing protein [Granulosicoccus sp.]